MTNELPDDIMMIILNFDLKVKPFNRQSHALIKTIASRKILKFMKRSANIMLEAQTMPLKWPKQAVWSYARQNHKLCDIIKQSLIREHLTAMAKRFSYVFGKIPNIEQPDQTQTERDMLSLENIGSRVFELLMLKVQPAGIVCRLIKEFDGCRIGAINYYVFTSHYTVVSSLVALYNNSEISELLNYIDEESIYTFIKN